MQERERFVVVVAAVAKPCPTICDPMKRSTPGFPALHYLPEFAQTFSCPLSWWCHPTISSSLALFSSCPQFFPASGSFSVNQFFSSGSQSIGVSVSVLPMNVQGWFPLELTGSIPLLSKERSRVFSSNTIWKQFFSLQPSSCCNSHIHNMPSGKTIALTIWMLLAKWCLCFLVCCLGLL